MRKGWFMQCSVEINSGEGGFLKFVNVCLLLRYYFPLETLHLTKLDPLHSWMLCAMSSWNWPIGSGEDFKTSSMYFLLFCYYIPEKQGMLFIWSYIHFLNPSRLKLVKLFWKNRYFNDYYLLDHIAHLRHSSNQ